MKNGNIDEDEEAEKDEEKYEGIDRQRPVRVTDRGDWHRDVMCVRPIDATQMIYFVYQCFHLIVLTDQLCHFLFHSLFV